MSCWTSGQLQPYQDALEALPCPFHPLLSPSFGPNQVTSCPHPHLSYLCSLPHYLPNLARCVLQSLSAHLPPQSLVSVPSPSLRVFLPHYLLVSLSISVPLTPSLSVCPSAWPRPVSLNPFNLSRPSSLVTLLPNPPWLTFRKSRVKPWSRLWRPRKLKELSWASASWIGAAVEGCTEAEGSSKSKISTCHIAQQAGRLWNP